MQANVRIVQTSDASASAAQAAADYVQVRAWNDPTEETLALATIQRVVLKTRTRNNQTPVQRHCVKTLLDSRPMSADEALLLATRYAERKRIPLVVKSTRGNEAQ